MAINRSFIQSVDIASSGNVAIQMVNARPSAEFLDYQRGTPNTLVGYYDSVRDVVELYIRDSSGFRLIKLA